MSPVRLRRALRVLVAGACASFSALATGAPLDSLLRASPVAAQPGSWSVELGYDAVNDTLDVFNIRDDDPDYAGTDTGDYVGAHLRAGVALSERIWLLGDYWQRRIEYGPDDQEIDSFSAALQYNAPVTDALTLGLRGGVWGNYASALAKSTPTTVSGVTLDSVTVHEPQDIQYQGDLVLTWQAHESLALSAFAGAGTSRVTVGQLVAGYNGCLYEITATATAVTGDQIGVCGPFLDSSFTIPTSTNLFQTLEYDARFLQAGVNLRWQHGRWSVAGGYLRRAIDREFVDDFLDARGRPSHTGNDILDGEIAWRAGRTLELFVRGEILSHQFVGEIPFAYNAMTATKFDRQYGLASFGVRGTFH